MCYSVSNCYTGHLKIINSCHISSHGRNFFELVHQVLLYFLVIYFVDNVVFYLVVVVDTSMLFVYGMQLLHNLGQPDKKEISMSSYNLLKFNFSRF